MVRDVLVTARTLIANGWTQGVYGRVIDGRRCYCPLGALAAAADYCLHNDAWSTHHDALALLSRAIGHMPIAMWNDSHGRTQAEALAAFDRAIALASE